MTHICLPKVYLEPALERRLLNRLKRIEGQVRGIQRMVTTHEPCDNILIQIGAVKQAVNAVAVELLEGHMDTCLAESLKQDQGAQALASLRGALAHVLRQGG